MKKKKRIEEDDVEFLIDLLFDTNMSVSEIAKELDVDISDVNKKINSLGLNWLKTSRRKMSRGQTALTLLLKKLIPGEEIINEYHIGDKLKIDIYCPKYKLAIEFHGRQHFYYTSRFFESKYEFEEAQKRDIKKEQYCRENGIILIVFRYNDSLNEESVSKRILNELRNADVPVKAKPKKNSIASSEYYQMMKKRNSEYRKSIYKKIKDNKIDDSR
jgi:very-short-patch-repair endonuclease